MLTLLISCISIQCAIATHQSQNNVFHKISNPWEVLRLKIIYYVICNSPYLYITVIVSTCTLIMFVSVTLPVNYTSQLTSDM